MKRSKWLGDLRATKADKQKKARQQTDQRMKHQDAQSRGDSNVTREARMVLSPDDPMAKVKRRVAARWHDRRCDINRLAPTSCWGRSRRSILTRIGVSPAPPPCWAQAPSYFEVGAELEGDLTAGPLLLPGNPGTLAAS